jgi:hypothetical protein
MFADGAFQMLQVLFQCRLVELGQELRLGGRVELADFLDELTFGHKVFTFAFGGKWFRGMGQRGIRPEGGIGYFPART